MVGICIQFAKNNFATAEWTENLAKVLGLLQYKVHNFAVKVHNFAVQSTKILWKAVELTLRYLISMFSFSYSF